MIESLNSPHIARVKALIGSRGTKERKSSAHFVAEGLQCAREAMVATTGPRIETLYVTPTGRLKVEQIADLNSFNVIEVSDDVMKAMSETITPQGILAVCSIPNNSLESVTLNGTRKFV
jgi:TrmH family RNA methyltransferase